MKYDHAKPLIERLMHVAVLYHMSPGMLRTRIFDALKELLETLEYDYESRKQGTGMSIFDTDKDKDIKLLKKHIKAMKLILKYYVGDL